MSKRKKILLTIAASLAGLVVLVVVAALIVVQTSWFANFVKEKIIATAEESTGGTVEIGSFEFDLRHLTIRIRDFVLHGSEPKTEDPLLRARLLELRLKLFSGLKKTVDLQYLGIDQPQVNLLLLPDGTTNIPQPKVPSKPSQTSGLQTVVDLAVNDFRIDHGLIKVLQEKTAFSGRGENLRVLLNYNSLKPAYSGNLSIDPLLLASGNRPPLNLHVNVPVTLERDAIRVADASLTSDHSRIVLSGSVENMNAPVIAAHLNVDASLPELQKSFDLPLNTKAKGAPQTLSAEVVASMNDATSAIHIQTAHMALGQTTFQASGDLNPGKQGSVKFNADLALAELSRLAAPSSTQAGGDLLVNGTATLNAHKDYAVDGTINSRSVSVKSGDLDVPDIHLYSPFHADPYLISMDGLKVAAYGGSLAAKLFVENLQALSLEGHLQNFSLPVLAAAFTGKHLGYDGFLNGSLLARGDLKAKGTTGYNAEARLTIAPGRRGIPLSGAVNANYAGKSGALDLGNSYLALPNSRLDLSGSLNHRIDLKLVSNNLNGFLPAANFGSAKPMATLPVTLQGGTATLQAQITGNTSSPHIAAHLDVNDFAVERRPLQRLALDLAASSSGASIQNGLLNGSGLTTNFDASIGLSKWAPTPRSPLSANLTLRNGNLADLMSMAGESSLQASGAATADIHVTGTYGNPLGGAVLQVSDGSIDRQPFSKFYANVNLADQLVSLSQLELDTAGGKITASGTFQHPRDSFTVGHAQLQLATDHIQLSDIQPIAQQNFGVAGLIQLNAAGAADLKDQNNQTSVVLSNVTADLSASGLRVQNQDAGNLTATARTRDGAVNYNLHSSFAGSTIAVNGQTALSNDYATTADASIRDLSVAKALQISGQAGIPASGDLSAEAHVRGTLNAPNANLSVALLKANVYQEQIDSLKGTLQYTNTSVNVPSIELRVPAGTVSLSGSFNHPANNFNAGALSLKLGSSDIALSRIEHVQQAKPGLGGTLRLAADLSASLREQRGKSELLISHLNGDLSANALHLNQLNLGGLNFEARTSGSTLNMRLDSDLAQSQIHGQGQAQLTGDYPLRASMTFGNIKYSNLAPFVSATSTAPPPYEAELDGQASVNGPLLNPDNLSARLQLNRVDLRTNAGTSPTGGAPLRHVEIQNNGTIVVTLDHDVVQIQHFDLGGRDTSLKASGSVNLKNASAPLNLNLNANLDLGLLQDADRDFYSSGSVTLDAGIRGSFAQPRANGRLELKNANVNYAGSPNGLSNANGVILLNGTNASIQNLTGESGGGKITLTGFVGLVGSMPSFNLRATASKVRVRYSGVSATSDASIALVGNLRRSLLNGTVTVDKLGYASSSDAGSLLSTAATPPSTPATPNPFLSGMRLDIHIVTSPDLEVVSTYSNRLSALANLTVRGTAENPGMLGRVSITDGQLVFFGNTYTVNTGTINFYNPNAIAPVLNVSLETIAQGVNVTIGVSGPIDDLKLNYRSDPPLTFEQIVQLLATNTTPANPVIAAHQPSPQQQSLSQMGESAVLGQAVANPLASRVQRVFGLSQFKIDPSVGGSNGPATARVTLQQKIASNITFTYITDVTQTNGQIIRVQWDLTNNLSAVGLRDYNGNVSVELLYKFTRR